MSNEKKTDVGDQLVLSDELIRRAAGLSSASLHEAGGKIGALPSSLKPLSSAMRLCGRALPVVVPPGNNLFLHHAIYAAQPGDVLVVDTAEAKEFGYWGEIMTCASQVRGLAGLVIAGGVRDTLRLIELQFPVFASGICIRGTMKDAAGAGSIGEPVQIGDIAISLGDLVFGDADGVVVLPSRQADVIVDDAYRREAEEQKILARLKGGETTLAIYDLPAVGKLCRVSERARR